MIMALFAVIAPAQAGVGMLDQGTSLYNANVSFTGGNKHWNAQRQVLTSICKRRNASLLQGYEYGYSYFHTIFASVNFAYRKCGQVKPVPGVNVVSGQAVGVGDVQLGVRTRFNHRGTAAWEALLIIPTGYDNTNPSRLGRGSLGLGLGLKFSSDVPRALVKRSSWGWKLGTQYTYFFSGKGNSLSSTAAVQYAVTATDFQQVGDFFELGFGHSVTFARSGVQQQIFFNQVPSSMTSADRLDVQLQYSHSFVGTGWSTSVHAGKAIVGRNNPVDFFAGAGLSYRWRE
ncbi:MAG: hypothetical protein COW18_04985 [Zetaproteobacteria bacterium CG12_big_fil_rev_8_21_14_0_65_54_13]|nr:MAG: hypothetical protein COX55_04595 [Zetaproteobacteria bacterium CG23_combo_of_CG06-09_8_20_14_all_54_7]PIW49668.1 MAG: hypothetical protein COW18_04985 [Zetaproteobacteria bacterium CG12_big_fil_rev_8_21_14_0_65_54_13]PIX55486.1 MAG: hypothetical protein COZ50_02490 [Zetaproteobacteria bacterium CG_4_10_14_3_um_filter_54_28]PJA27417.1 MAG: hypothetical protein CO188_12465 [Zetaproteobacteria bacterium CG_4_9_14_3_um_filter_54_145]